MNSLNQKSATGREAANGNVQTEKERKNHVNNICHNRISLFGTPDVLEQFKQQAFEGEAPSLASDRIEPFILFSVVPHDDELWCGIYRPFEDEYDGGIWCGEVFLGCAVMKEHYYGGLEIHFTTKWGPPPAFLRDLSKAWPDLIFNLHYEDMLQEAFGYARAKMGNVEEFWEVGFRDPARYSREIWDGRLEVFAWAPSVSRLYRQHENKKSTGSLLTAPQILDADTKCKLFYMFNNDNPS